ncbi:hypothetical protein HDU82_006701 [Entophlyctis luteolus]|nr:hypothetical protein HDU82_006701 [Entophlyctis luteolus]
MSDSDVDGSRETGSGSGSDAPTAPAAVRSRASARASASAAVRRRRAHRVTAHAAASSQGVASNDNVATPTRHSSRAPLGQTVSLVFENIAEESALLSLLNIALELTASPERVPSPADVSLILSAVLPALLAPSVAPTVVRTDHERDSDPVILALRLVQFARQILSVHGPLLFRHFWGCSSERNFTRHRDSSDSSHSVGNFWLDLRRFMVDLMKIDLEDSIKRNRIRSSMMFELFDNRNMTSFLKAKNTCILDTIFEIQSGDFVLHACLCVEVTNVVQFVFFCAEFPSFNPERIKFEFLGESFWAKIDDRECDVRLQFYQGIESSQFRTYLIHNDLELCPEWSLLTSIEYDVRTTFVTQELVLSACFHAVPAKAATNNALDLKRHTDSNRNVCDRDRLAVEIAVLVQLLHFLVWDCKCNGEVLPNTKARAVAEFEAKVCAWVDGNAALASALVAPLRLWALL